MRENYPRSLVPLHSLTLEVDGGSIRIPLVHLRFRPWKGEKVCNTFGGKPIVSYEGKPMFAEVAILQILTKDGWSCRWIETYGSSKGGEPFYFSNWIDAPLKEQESQPNVTEPWDKINLLTS